MNIRNIFQRDPTDEVRVPEIEVQGDEVRVPQKEDAEESDLGEQKHSPEQRRKTEYRLPKTKWFAQSKEIG
jgi:hypothetical protein